MMISPFRSLSLERYSRAAMSTAQKPIVGNSTTGRSVDGFQVGSESSRILSTKCASGKGNDPPLASLKEDLLLVDTFTVEGIAALFRIT